MWLQNITVLPSLHGTRTLPRLRRQVENAGAMKTPVGRLDCRPPSGRPCTGGWSLPRSWPSRHRSSRTAGWPGSSAAPGCRGSAGHCVQSVIMRRTHSLRGIACPCEAFLYWKRLGTGRDLESVCQNKKQQLLLMWTRGGSASNNSNS